MATFARRTREIRPSFFTSQQVEACGPWARLLFIGLWTLADHCGRLQDDPYRIKRELFAADSMDIETALGELTSVGLIRRYHVGEVRCIDIPKFTTHQHPHPRERARPSQLPEFPRDMASHEQPRTATAVPECSGWDLHSTSRPSSSIGSVGKEPTEPHSTAAPPSPAKQRLNGVSQERIADFTGAWNKLAQIHGLPRVTLPLNPKRLTALKARLQEHIDDDFWLRALRTIPSQAFLLGDNDRKWRANFDWFVRVGTAEKLVEGQYSGGDYGT